MFVHRCVSPRFSGFFPAFRVFALASATLFIVPMHGQTSAPAAAAAASSQRGTVKSIDGSVLMLTTDTGKVITVNLSATARVMQIAPGVTDLKTAQSIQLSDVSPGDRVLVTGRATETPDTLAGSRVVLMKSSDIAQRNAQSQADWQRRGSGGIVSTVDSGSGTISVASGARKVEVKTTGTTVFRRYSGDSVKFEDAQPSTLAAVQTGDQVRVRGAKSEDGTSIAAEEVVSGTFRNLAGTIASVDAAAGTLTLKDLATKKNVMVKVTENSDLRLLPPEAAARFAARGRSPEGSTGTRPAGAPGGVSTASAADHRASAGGQPASTTGQSGAPGGYSRPAGAGGGRPVGMDLAQMIPRLPKQPLAALKPGDAVMIVASQAQTGAASATAITMLSGVEPILAANPTGSPTLTISPWNVGGGAPDGGLGGPQ